MISCAPPAQASVAIVDFPIPELPTKARADSPTCTALACSTATPCSESRNESSVPEMSTPRVSSFAPGTACTVTAPRSASITKSQVW